ncbi:MAG: hypothetical protein IIY45_00895, partial [Firmicutes bacterium]|nr:hypothetical protein [Bacillota bacterium]
DLALAPSYLFSQVLTPELWSSVFELFFGISSLAGAAVLSARPQKEKAGRSTALWLLALAVVMVVLAVSYWLMVDRGAALNSFLIAFCLICLAVGAMISFINIPISTVMMRIIDKDKLSKVTSIISIGSQGMVPIASVLAGSLLQKQGSTALLAVCAIGFLATALLLLMNPRIREI